MERLDKILAKEGFGTRKDVRRLARAGTITVNGAVVKDPSLHVDIEHDVITVSGEVVTIQQNVYLMLNKCQNVVSANKDGEHDTVFDLLDDSYRTGACLTDLHTIGRLDIDTEGLLLLTTDGALTHTLISPKSHIAKTYIAYLRDTLTEEQRQSYIERFKAGIHIAAEGNESEADCQSAQLSWNADVTYNNATRPVACLTIYEGKYHQVKRMFAAVGNEVVFLKRIAMGQLHLDESLQPGEYRELTEEELALLRQEQ
ncbi:MAG: rRNA pseudouridine synthase [Treponema sp.]|nr:rRNA pseudouridine synthase [Treponema sp.]